MKAPLRIFLRVLGLVLFLGSLAGVVLIVAAGPDEVGRQMGKNCRHVNNGPSEWCTWQDALGIMQALPWITLVGGVLILLSRREDAPRGRLSTIAGLAATAVIVVNLAGVFVYRASYTVVTTVETGKKILRDAPRPDFSKPAQPAKPRTAAAPKGLARGSLLRTGPFRAAMADLRRAAPAGGRLTKLRVAADRIDAEVLAGGRAVTLRRAWNGKAAVVSTDPATGGERPLITFARLDPAAPQRVTTAAAQATDQRPADVTHLVLMDIAGLRWHAYTTSGEQVTASPEGRLVR